MGLPESIEGPRKINFFATLLTQLVVDQILPSPSELEQAHWSLAPKPQHGERPTPVIIRFHNYQTREKVFCVACKIRSELRYEGNPVAILEDFTPEVAEQRAAYREVMSLLYKRGLRPTLRYPARLYIIMDGGTKVLLPSVEEAKRYLAANGI